jgi:very-short-patch-repair endonuclease
MIDLDGFKAVNDRHGHETGDRVLVAAADALQRALRAEDVLGRLGGEEFLAVLPDTGAVAAARAAERLRAAVAGMARPGAAALRRVLDYRTFSLTDSALERRLLPIARRAGLPKPLTRQIVNGFRVDFYWPYLRLIVETDGLRYHRTPAQQARDRQRDQALTAAGFTVLRFTHAKVAFEPVHVEATLRAVAVRLAASR